MQIIAKRPTIVDGSKIKRVAAYARVSNDEDNLHSLSQQVSYYNEVISRRPEWAFTSVYSDEGLSGTKDERPGFQHMLEDARGHKFDMLITKSVTRLARNTVTLLKAVRELKGLGIDVYFEKEDIHSISPDGEMMLTLLAMYAEEEARSASENKRWQIKRCFERGDPIYLRLYGYRWENGLLVVVPEEAMVVKRIFDLYLNGKGPQAITKIIRREYPEKAKEWKTTTIYKMLRNEKYKGDLLLQKTHVPDFRTKKQYKNKGQWVMYLVQGAHEAIIAPEVFDKVQDEIKRRERVPAKKDSAPKLFTGKILCGHCGACFRRARNNSAKDKPYFWICRTFMREGADICHNKRILESILILKTKEVLGMRKEEELTRAILDETVDHIEALSDNHLRFFLKSGKVETVEWQNPSRSESWTKEMREKARQRGLSRTGKRIA